MCRAGGIRIYHGEIGDEILPIQHYHDGREDQYELFSGLVIFRLLVPSLQPGVVGPYPIRGAWFPNCLPLKGTDRI
jgi:hypothetical protein